MKKYIALFLSVIMLLSAAGCQKASSLFHEGDTSEEVDTIINADDGLFKVGYIFPAEAEAPDTEAREQAVRKMQKETGLPDAQVMIVKNISGEQCAEELKTLCKKGCDLIFACGVRYEKAVLEVAKDHEDVQFCIEGARESIKSELANVHTYNSRIYEAYYAAGIACGTKINEMLNDGKVSGNDCRVGFVAYNENNETTTCINAFYLGIKQVCSQTKIDVRYVGKRGDYDADGEAARQLAASGVCMMCQYTYTTAVVAVCAENEIPVIGNETNIINIAPSMAITSTYTDWSVYYNKTVKAAMEGAEIDKDWCGGYKEGVVRLTQLNDGHIADGTASRIIDVEALLRNNEAKIFDISSIYFDGESLESLISYSDDFSKYANYIADGELKEQFTKSSPVFGHLMDGISISTENYIPEETEEAEEEER